MADEEDAGSEALEAARKTAFRDRQARVNAALLSGKAPAAVKIALENPPFASKDQSLKDDNFALIQKSLIALSQREPDVAALLEQVTLDEADTLMKYVYRGLQRPDNSAFLLKLHAQLVEKSGLGSCVRAITDRKTA